MFRYPTFLTAAFAALALAFASNAASYAQDAPSGSSLDARTIHNDALNAEQLLLYARVRSIGHADYDRTERQRKVVTAAFNKIRTMSVSQLTQIANAALPCVTTDLSNSEILNYVYMVGANRMSIAGTLRIPADGTHTPQMIRGMSVLLPDLDANSTILREFLYQ